MLITNVEPKAIRLPLTHAERFIFTENMKILLLIHIYHNS